MPSVVKCPVCGDPVPGDAPHGLCPACLLKRAFDVSVTGPSASPVATARGTRAETWNDLRETVSYRSPRPGPPRPEVGPREVMSVPRVDFDRLIGSLTELKLMAPGEIQSFLGQFPIEGRPTEAEPFARELVRARKLTEYQAGALLQGKTRGLVIGNYLILDKLGAGGMGMVFKAQHRRMKRIVAMKVLPPSYARDESAVHRFQREAEAVARLGHPNIVTALDADEFNGLHFFVMEYVQGSDLTRLVKSEGALPVDRALAYLTQAARGLKAAHDRGIFHRDIKPSNLMLDTAGTIKILDLGLARMAKDADFFGSDEPDLGLTRPGDLMGTVAFMPPEQAYNAKDADHRSDIYSLGCTLYYLLTGRPPYSGVTRMACLLAHREQAIPRLREARPEIPEYLDTTLARMMAKAPDDRYASIDALLDDLAACGVAGQERANGRVPGPEEDPDPLDDDEAGGASALAHPARWRMVAAVAAVAIVATLATVVAARPRPATRVASNVVRGDIPALSNGPAPSLDSNGARPPSPPPGGTPGGTETEAPKPAEPVGEVGAFRLHAQSPVQGIAAATDARGRSLALSAGLDHTACLWDVDTGEEIRRLPHDGPVFAVAFSPADTRFALSAGFDKTIRLWDLVDGREVARFRGHEKAIYSVAFSRDGRRVLSGSGDRTLRLWDAATTVQLDRLEHDGPVTSLAYSPAGTRVVSGSEDKSVRVWDFWDDKGKEIYRLDGPAAVLCVSVSPDGHRALSGGSDGALTLWDIDRGREIRRIKRAQDYVECVTFFPDGRRAISGTRAGKLNVWDVREEDLEHSRVLEGPVGHLGVAAMADGCHVLTSDDDGAVRLWNLPAEVRPAVPPLPAVSPPVSIRGRPGTTPASGTWASRPPA